MISNPNFIYYDWSVFCSIPRLFVCLRLRMSTSKQYVNAYVNQYYSKSWTKVTVGTGCSAPIQLDTGTVQGSVLFDLFLNALLRLLDATGITHGIKRTPQWNHAAFADDLSIYVITVRDANKLLDIINEFEFWSELWISIPKSLATGAMYSTGTARRQELRGKSRRGKEEKRCRPRHLKSSNPGPRSHGRGFRCQ